MWLGRCTLAIKVEMGCNCIVFHGVVCNELRERSA
jgi:hypothetical protein